MSLIGIIIALVVFAILCGIVSLIPLPASPPWLRNILYIALLLVLLLWLLGGMPLVPLRVR